ncbi:MAG: hypothetical protein ACRDS0_02540 [Pseudonocardiaceae bacterium]
MAKDDVFDAFEDPIRARAGSDGVDSDRAGSGNPWLITPGGRRYEPDYGLLQTLLAIPIDAGSGSESGRLASAIDAWVAAELRRAGFPADEVWPRLTKPRVLPREVGLFLHALPKKLRSDVEAHLVRNATVAPRDAKVLGRAYVKQVDVVIAQWSRGPELMVSTKSMVSSFGNNLKNRFEESYGDAKNLRARFPLAAIGFLFVFRSTILAQPGRFESAIDMLRKLRSEMDVYDATCMVIAEWADDQVAASAPTHRVTIRNDVTPPDLQADQFMAAMIEAVLDRTPIETHVEVRERHEHRVLPVNRLDAADGDPDDASD